MLDESLFVSDIVHSRDVEINKDKVIRLHFKEIPAIEFIKFQRALNSEDEDTRSGAIAVLIAASLCEADGTPAMTVDKAMRLKTKPMDAIFKIVMEINGGDNSGKA